jgi:hypothetical protein
MDEKRRKKNLLKSLNKNREKNLNKVYRWKEYFLKSSLTTSTLNLKRTNVTTLTNLQGNF